MADDNQKESPGYRRFGRPRTQQPRRSIRQRFFSRRPPETTRRVYVDNKFLPGEEADQLTVTHQYPDNTVVSSKYTLLTFLPKNLFEQFRRIANFYFLCVALIQFVIDTPVTPLTSILPLVFVISVTAIKQGYEDWLRHKADSEVNLRPAMVVRDGRLHQSDIRAMDIKVGDVVKVLVNEEFPCDMVMLSSADPQGQCFVTTANLDGETNLKTHYCLNSTRQLNTPEQLGQLRACIECKPPIADLYTFEGVMEIETPEQKQSLGPENLLLRGARLKNTPYIYGCAVYTGKETRMALNSKFKKTKFSQVERKMNTFLIIFLVVLLVESVLATGLKYWFEGNHPWPWYVDEESSKNEALKVVEHALAFMVLFNYIIPISLYVTVELQKFLGSIYFGWDVEMYDATINERARANTSDLNEELGQVEYLFTDKTGTLTENTMMFRQCCIGSRQFEEVDGKFCEKINSDINLTEDIQFTQEMDDFFKVLVLCHTVRVDGHIQGEDPNGASSVYSSTGEDYEYQASSPDEKALVEACCKYGIVYHGTSDDVMEVTFHGTMRRFRLLHTLPFDATRKRMSVIIEDEDGAHVLLCKGAEVAILDRAVSGDAEVTQRYIDEYAVLGLRTLTIANRKFSKEEYMEYDRKLTEARQSLARRNEMLAEVFNEVEQNLTVLGATAVEDKLQDQVPQTIEALRMAGIKVWVLTGDKEETAVNISHSAGHFNSDMIEHRLTQVTSLEQCDEQLPVLLQAVASTPRERQIALIIDGMSLAYAMKETCKKDLQELCSKCNTVLCCRMSPIQKAEVVAMIKHSPSNPVTAAIGDGANDVSMIQEAHVGLGIMGKEGRQAVRTSDYAFGKFRFLRRALLLHGHLYYNRISMLVQYFFYKNIAWITAQMFYAIFNAFSQQSLFDPYFLVFYNLTFTSLPILIYGLFEIHKPKDDLLNKPKLYRAISRNAVLNWPQFIGWNVLGLWHCCVSFFGHYFLMWDGVSLFHSGKTIGNFDFGTLILYTTVTIVNIKLMLETYYWCLPIVLSYVITFLGLILLTAIYTNVFWPDWMVTTNDMFRVLNQIYATPTTWLAFLLLVLMALLPDLLLKVIKNSHLSQRLDCCGRLRRSSRHKGIGALNGQAQRVKSTPRSPSVPSSETIELQQSTGRSSITGFVNPALSLSSENLPTTNIPTDTTKFSIEQGLNNGRNTHHVDHSEKPVQHQGSPENTDLPSQNHVTAVSDPKSVQPANHESGNTKSPGKSGGKFATIISVQSNPKQIDISTDTTGSQHSSPTNSNSAISKSPSHNNFPATSDFASERNLTTSSPPTLSPPPTPVRVPLSSTSVHPSQAATLSPWSSAFPNSSSEAAADFPSFTTLPHTPSRTSSTSSSSAPHTVTPSTIHFQEESSEREPSTSPAVLNGNNSDLDSSEEADTFSPSPTHSRIEGQQLPEYRDNQDTTAAFTESTQF